MTTKQINRFKQLAGLLNENEQQNLPNPNLDKFLEDFENSYGSEVWDFLDGLSIIELESLYVDIYHDIDNVKSLSVNELKQHLYDYWENPSLPKSISGDDSLEETTIIDKNIDRTKSKDIAKRDGIDLETVDDAIELAKKTDSPVTINESNKNNMKKSQFKKLIKEGIKESLGAPVNPSPIREMAAIKGDIKSRIDQLIADNPEMEVPALSRLIINDPELNAIIDDADLNPMAQNQTQKYIRVVRGERTVGKRGRKADPNKQSKPKTQPKTDERREEMIKALEAFDGFRGDDVKWKGKFNLLTNPALEDYIDKYNLIPAENLNEMAKLVGDLKTSIESVISDNPDLENLPLKKAIKADPDVIAALGDQTLHDNQLNRFIQSFRSGDIKISKSKKTSSPSPLDNDDDVEVEDKWGKEEDEFTDIDDIEDDGFTPDEDLGLDLDPDLELNRQNVKKFWNQFTVKMKELKIVDIDGKILDKEKYMKYRKEAQSQLD